MTTLIFPWCRKYVYRPQAGSTKEFVVSRYNVLNLECVAIALKSQPHISLFTLRGEEVLSGSLLLLVLQRQGKINYFI